MLYYITTKVKSEEFIKLVGKQIKQIRTSKGLSLLDLSALSNIEKANLSKMENGKSNLTLRTLLTISDALNVNPYELLKYDE